MDASGKPVFYEYDWRGNLSAVKDGNGETLAAYAHTPGGRLKEIRHGNGIRTGYEYDTDGNLVHTCTWNVQTVRYWQTSTIPTT